MPMGRIWIRRSWVGIWVRFDDRYICDLWLRGLLRGQGDAET